jgi:chemotaxis protein CheC
MDMKFKELITPFYLDALKEMGNVGAGNAATALSKMVGRKIHVAVSRVTVLPLSAVAEFMGGRDADVAAVYLPIQGDVNGKVLLFFPLDRLQELLRMLTGEIPGDTGDLNELEASAIKELGSIMTGSYLGALSRFIHLTMVHGLPELTLDMAQAVLDSVLVELEQSDNLVVVVESEMSESDKLITGHILLFPEVGSIEKIFHAFSQALGLPEG